jgi:hypothetical protein
VRSRYDGESFGQGLENFNVLSFLVLTALAKKESRAEGWILSRRPVKDDIPT